MNRKEALARMTMDDEHQYSKLSNEAIELKLSYTYDIECVISEESA